MNTQKRDTQWLSRVSEARPYGGYANEEDRRVVCTSLCKHFTLTASQGSAFFCKLRSGGAIEHA
ncbi:hypothetical protein [Microcoleus sp. D2_18a_B4]|uniref:hypothetical protein n=1 Tax=Microcoleus sp. D2_18a_B4 TaxID=3055329 RepID=UPI002FD15EC7